MHGFLQNCARPKKKGVQKDKWNQRWTELVRCCLAPCLINWVACQSGWSLSLWVGDLGFKCFYNRDLCHECISSRRKDNHFQWMVVYLFCRKTWFPGTNELKFLRIAWGRSAQIHGSLGQMAPDSQEQYVFSRKMGSKHGSPRQPKFPR